MSQSTKSNKPFSLSRLEDATLGAFALVPSSQTLDHLVRYLSTWSGSEFSIAKFYKHEEIRSSDTSLPQQVIYGMLNGIGER